MNADESIRLITAIGGVLGKLVWPAFLLFLAVRFRAQIGDFFSRMTEFSLKGAGFEATARTQAQMAANLAAAELTQNPSADPAEVTKDAVAAVPDARSARRLEGRRVLWVDDAPDNNRYERQALEAAGILVSVSTSTDDALDRLARDRYDLVVSDMSRPPDQQAGYTLLDRLRQRGDKIPFMIYAGSSSRAYTDEARRRGAIGSTNRPQELIRSITGALNSVSG